MRLSIVAISVLTVVSLFSGISNAVELDVPKPEQYLFIEHSETNTRLTPALQKKLNAILKGLIDPRSILKDEFESPVSDVSGWGVIAIVPGKMAQAKRAINKLEGFEANAVMDVLSDSLVPNDWKPVPNLTNSQPEQETASARALVMRSILTEPLSPIMKRSERAQLAENLLFSAQSMIEAYESLAKAYARSVRIALIRQKADPEKMDKIEMDAVNSSLDMQKPKLLFQFGMRNAQRIAGRLNQTTYELAFEVLGKSGSLARKLQSTPFGNPNEVDFLYDILEADLRKQVSRAQDYEKLVSSAVDAEVQKEGGFRATLDTAPMDRTFMMVSPDIVDLDFLDKSGPETSAHRVVYHDASFSNWLDVVDLVDAKDGAVALKARQRLQRLFTLFQIPLAKAVSSIHDLEKLNEATDIAKYRAENDKTKSFEQQRAEVVEQLRRQGRVQRVGSSAILGDILRHLQSMALGRVYRSTNEERVEAAVASLIVLQDLQMFGRERVLQTRFEFMIDRMETEAAHSKFVQENPTIKRYINQLSSRINAGERQTKREVYLPVQEPKTCEALFR